MKGREGMKLKKMLAMVMALGVLTMGLAACGGAAIEGENDAPDTNVEEKSNDDSADETSGNGSIGLSVSTLNNPFFVTLTEGAEEKAGELGVGFTVVDAGDDASKQVSDIEDLISKNISVLIVNPVDSDAVAPAVEDAIAAGIKVIAVDRVVNGVDVDCSIASDNVAGAEMATEYLVELVGEGEKVAELEGTAGASATIDRGEGFHNVADEKLDIVSSQTADFNRSEGLTVMENIIQSDGDIKGVFAHNDEMALGAIEAIEASGKDIVVIGFDATDDALASIANGVMKATVAQKPDLMGATAVETAFKLINGESVDKELPVEVELVKE